MKRSGIVHFSSLSIALTALFFAVLGAALLISGGQMFSPGRVTASARVDQAEGKFTSHADFERECARCHQPLRAAQGELCMECHRDIGTQVTRQAGLHGRLPDPLACAACHGEHQGRGFDPVEQALASFDHNALTALPLEGKHANLECADCHAGGRYDQARATCMTCHEEPEVHAGLLGQDCAGCHTPAGWKPALWNGQPFDHAGLRFTLARHATGYDGGPMLCSACHVGVKAELQPEACVDCHGVHDPKFMGDHQRDFGLACLDCHDGADRMSGFDHARVFPLEGRHASLECQDCHAGMKFTGLGSDCVACHAEPEIHAGAFGTECQLCHTAEGWLPALLSSHSFPLDHGEEGEIACKTCHPSSYTTYVCTDCHEHTADEVADDHRGENIPAAELERCAECHPDGKE